MGDLADDLAFNDGIEKAAQYVERCTANPHIASNAPEPIRAAQLASIRTAMHDLLRFVASGVRTLKRTV